MSKVIERIWRNFTVARINSYTWEIILNKSATSNIKLYPKKVNFMGDIDTATWWQLR